MSEIRFYHLEHQNLYQVLPILLNKALKNKYRIIIKTHSKDEVEQLSKHLWSYKPEGFIPHGSQKDNHEKHQPIWITTQDENPNNADMLILVHNTKSEQIDQFKLCCEIFDGQDQNALQQARTQWKTYKNAGHDMAYWQQGPKGRWEQKS